MILKALLMFLLVAAWIGLEACICVRAGRLLRQVPFHKMTGMPLIGWVVPALLLLYLCLVFIFALFS